MDRAAGLPSVGVLGLGIIGSRVARRLADAGFALSVWNRTPRPIPGLPAAAATPRDVARSAEILEIFVADDAALQETIEALTPDLRKDHVVISHATVAPATVRRLATHVQAAGAAFLDAPFTGSRDAAAQGQITYYVSGEDSAAERVRPVLEASAWAIIPLGAVGRASAVKIATNIMAAAAAVSLAEAVNLLRANSIDPTILSDVLATNAARSGVTDLKLPCMLTGDFAPRFSARNMRKDLRLARDITAAGASGLTAALLALYEQTCEAGHAEEDFAAVVKLTADCTTPQTANR